MNPERNGNISSVHVPSYTFVVTSFKANRYKHAKVKTECRTVQ